MARQAENFDYAGAVYNSTLQICVSNVFGLLSCSWLMSCAAQVLKQDA